MGVGKGQGERDGGTWRRREAISDGEKEDSNERGQRKGRKLIGMSGREKKWSRGMIHKTKCRVESESTMNRQEDVRQEKWAEG